MLLLHLDVLCQVVHKLLVCIVRVNEGCNFHLIQAIHLYLIQQHCVPAQRCGALTVNGKHVASNVYVSSNTLFLHFCIHRINHSLTICASQRMHEYCCCWMKYGIHLCCDIQGHRLHERRTRISVCLNSSSLLLPKESMAPLELSLAVPVPEYPP